jgi:hypothetical protein
MAGYFRPRCGSLLAADFLRTAGPQYDCPERDESLSVAEVAPDSTRPGSLNAPAAGLAEESLPGARLRSYVAGSQLVLHIPPGSSRRARSLGLFAAVWCAFVGVFTAMAIGTGGLQPPQVYVLVPFLAVFWLIGLAMFRFWLWARFGKTYVLLEPDRVVVRKELFSREKFKESSLREGSRAKLEMVYEEDGRPVYCVAVTTAAKPARFGTFLAPEEKDWLVERINRHLGRQSGVRAAAAALAEPARVDDNRNC